MLLSTGMVLLSAEDSMERMFGLDWQLLADATLTAIAVFFLFIAMSYFLFNPARKLLKDRREKIKGELETAAGDMEMARALKEEYEDKLREINKEAEGILSETRKKALANENQIIAQAKEEAVRIMDRARVEAELEKKKAADDVKREMITIASMMAGKVVASAMDMTVQNSLLDETLKEMGENTWLS